MCSLAEEAGRWGARRRSRVRLSEAFLIVAAWQRQSLGAQSKETVHKDHAAIVMKIFWKWRLVWSWKSAHPTLDPETEAEAGRGGQLRHHTPLPPWRAGLRNSPICTDGPGIVPTSHCILERASSGQQRWLRRQHQHWCSEVAVPPCWGGGTWAAGVTHSSGLWLLRAFATQPEPCKPVLGICTLRALWLTL